MSEEKPTKTDLICEGIEATTRQALKISRLQKHNQELEARLKAYEEGVDSKEADKSQNYQYINEWGRSFPIVWSSVDQCWNVLFEEQWIPFTHKRFHPLPPINKEEE